MCCRSALARARHDTRAWVVARRERTRHLIELGGLVVKAKLDTLTDDDRVVIYGALLTLAMVLKGEERASSIELWRRRGRRGFDADAGGR
jgi:hypothetical protein